MLRVDCMLKTRNVDSNDLRQNSYSKFHLFESMNDVDILISYILILSMPLRVSKPSVWKSPFISNKLLWVLCAIPSSLWSVHAFLISPLAAVYYGIIALKMYSQNVPTMPSVRSNRQRMPWNNPFLFRFHLHSSSGN